MFIRSRILQIVAAAWPQLQYIPASKFNYFAERAVHISTIIVWRAGPEICSVTERTSAFVISLVVIGRGWWITGSNFRREEFHVDKWKQLPYNETQYLYRCEISLYFAVTPFCKCNFSIQRKYTLHYYGGSTRLSGVMIMCECEKNLGMSENGLFKGW